MRHSSLDSKLQWLIAALLATTTVVLYRPTFGRGFVSEDFLILRQFFEAQEAGHFFKLAWQHFTGPWLDISLVAFFRPLSSLILQLEWAVFGTATAGYLSVHLIIHLLNAWQVQDLIAGLRFSKSGSTIDRAIPYAGAGLFALYPLHPNTVVFIASFATLYAVGFMLLCLRLFLRERYLGALVAYCAALGCYEQAAVLPACLLTLDVLSRSGTADEPAGRWVRRARRHTPFWLVLVGYLILRRLLLGHSIGGYESFRARLANP